MLSPTILKNLTFVNSLVPVLHTCFNSEESYFLLHLFRVCLLTETTSQKDSLPIKLSPLLQKTAIPSEQPTADVDSSAPDPESINSADPLFAMEAKLTKLKKLSLSEAAELTFNELIKNVVLKVSGKR